MKNRLEIAIFFFSILILPLGMGITYYSQSMNILKENFHENTSLNLKSKIDLFDQMIKEVESLRETVVQDPDIVMYQKKNTGKPFTGTNTARIMDLQREMINISAINQMVINYYISFPYSDTVISPQGAYNQNRFFEGIIAPADRSLDLQALLEREENNRRFIPGLDIRIDEKQYSTIAYVAQMGFPQARGYFILFLNRDLIDRFFWGLLPSEESSLAVYNKGDLLLSSGWKKDDAASYLTFTYAIPSSAMEGKLFIPQSHLRKIMKPLRRLNGIISLFFLALGILIALYLQRRSRRPLMQLHAYVKDMLNEEEEDNSDSDAGYILKQFEALNEREKDLVNRIDSQKPLLIQDLFNSLLTGTYSSIEETLVRAEALGINTEGTGYSVILIEEQDTVLHNQLNRAVLENLFSNEERVDAYPAGHRNGFLTLILIHSGIDDDPEKALSSLTERLNRTLEENRLSSCGGAGRIYRDPSRLAASLHEAETAVGWRNRDEPQDIGVYREHDEEDQIFQFRENEENRLISLITEGSEDEVIPHLETIYRINFSELYLTGELRQLLLFQIQGSLIRNLAGRLKAGEDRNEFIKNIREMQLQRNPEAHFTLLRSEILRLTALFREYGFEEGNNLSSKITSYIEEKFNDPMMGLDMIARHFSLSAVYISSQFKEKTGINCSSLIEEKRIEKALVLLRQNRTVKETAGLVGYGSSGTFIRAFKRQKGFTPSAYVRYDG